MSRVTRSLRAIALWLGPTVVLLLVAVVSFVVWCVGTEPGTRWALRTAMEQVQGEAQGIEGTIWKGLRVQRLAVKTPVVDIHLTDLNLQVDWRELWQHRLHAREISAGKLSIDILQSDQPPSESPFAMPALPVQVLLDRVALGHLSLSLGGEPVLLDVQNLQAALKLSDENASLVFQSLELGRDNIQAGIEGEVKVFKLAEPWPLSVHLKTRAQSSQPDSLLCLRHFLPDLPVPDKKAAVPVKAAAQPVGDAATDATTKVAVDAGPEDGGIVRLAQLSAACAVDMTADLTGSLDTMSLKVAGDGQDVRFNVSAELQPRKALPLSQADFNIHLVDGSSLKGALNVDSVPADGASREHIVSSIVADKLNLAILMGPDMPGGLLSATLGLDAQLQDGKDVLSAALALDVGQGSRWNGQPLSGLLKARLINTLAAAPPDPARPDAPALWQGLQVSDLDMDLRLGGNRLKGKGALGAPGSALDLTVAAARLADFWPGLPGGVQAQAHLAGTLAKHEARLKAVYAPQPGKSQELGKGPVQANIALDGGWDAQAQPQGWKGRVTTLDVSHIGLGVKLQSPVAVSYVPQALAPAWQWQVGAATLNLGLPLNQRVAIRHLASQGRDGSWETRGSIDRLAVSRRLLRELQKILGVADAADDGRGGIVVALDERNERKEIVYAADWNLKFAGALDGQAHIKRVSGDLIVPGNPDFPLGLQTFSADLTAKPEGPAVSRLTAKINAATAKMGRAQATASALLHSAPGAGFTMNPKDVKTVELDAEIKDLGWLSLLVGDAMDFGGAVQAKLSAQSRPNGTWATNGTVNGQGIRMVRIDDGVRLLDGTLAAHFDGDRFILDSLRFPARLRVTPKEWRTAEWVSSNPDARDGSLTLTGSWDLAESVGVLDMDLYRYPILQRSDRYAMVTGKLHVDAPSPAISLSGKITADAGWVDLDMLSSVPVVDSDVVVLRKGQTQKASAPMDISMELDVDLGPRFYITGYGVDSGLVGNMHISMQEGKLTAMGALRTRGGALDVYGQHLQLRRGSLTFQGDISNPVLSIEALRTGLSVEAGVRVAGTAKRPRIDLVSYPDVSDVQKLSWLLLGRGPDDSGGDAALLFSVGTSLLTGGEPFYRKFGLDEISMRSGTLGSTGSLLPVESVVRGLDSGTSDIERKFVVASKNLSEGLTVSLEQALSETGTVGRLSYQLARGLSADLSVGTVTGIALIYRTIFRD
ncbi:translocation/assembly module TamB domain-containing protein [Eoetvoesiella caeni]